MLKTTKIVVTDPKAVERVTKFFEDLNKKKAEIKQKIRDRYRNTPR